MLAAERRELVLRLLRQDRFASVADIARLAHASLATVRRDLADLERRGLAVRVRGGTSTAPSAGAQPPQLPLEDRLAIGTEQKRRIARRAAELCRDGETVIVDGGSTTQQLAPFLREMRLRVITNSLSMACELASVPSCTVILGGGVVHPDSRLVLDPFCDDPFANYAASIAFMGVYGIDESGATNTDEALIRAERAMIGRASRLVILADSTKFDRRGSLWLCGFERVSVVVTDAGVPERYRGLLADRGVELLIA
jgi:DeoR family ulaG and ulaABCDEF operon transcriptional repressor